MTKRSFQIGSVVAVGVVTFVIATHWREQPQTGTPKADARAESRAEPADHGVSITAGDTQDARSPSGPPPAAALIVEHADAAPKGPVTALQELEEVVEGIDPSLGGKNLIVVARDSTTKGPGLVEMEQQFRREGTDPAWSKQMESQILDQISRVSGLSLVTLNAECRETICRAKLVYPPAKNVLSWLERLKPLATQLGFFAVVELATIGEDGVPMSVIYLQREGP